MERIHQVVWAAGFFDGEGTITFGGKPSYGAWIFLQVGQRVREPLDLFVELFGGYIIEVPSGPFRPNDTSFSWRTSTKADCRGTLADMLPYLVVKQAQASLAIEWIDLAPGRGRRLEPTLQMRREAIIAEIRQLKRPWER